MKIALITGTSKGLGFSIAQKLLAEDYIVIGVARSKSAFQQKDSYKHIQGDIRQGDVIEQIFIQIKIFGRLDLVILNAG